MLAAAAAHELLQDGEHALGPERAFDKLQQVTEGLTGAVPLQLRIALHGVLEARLKFGVIQFLIEGGLSTLSAGDVPVEMRALLTRKLRICTQMRGARISNCI